MATWHKFTGMVKWLKFRPDQLDTKFDDDGVWSVDFYPDDPEAFKATGIQLEPKQSPDGVFFRPKRKKLLSYRDKETKEKKEIEFEPPSIKLQTAGGRVEPFTGHDVGNGSRGVLVFSLFPLKRIQGYGHRWEEFIITDLVDITADPSVPATKTPETTSVEMDDDIPF